MAKNTLFGGNVGHRRIISSCKAMILWFFAALGLFATALAQGSLHGADDDLSAAVKACRPISTDPFRSVAEIQKEVECIANVQNSQAIAPQNPALRITARNERWEYIYVLAGRSTDSIACRVSGNLLLPRGRAINVTISSDDTIHEWKIPALGVKLAAMPGRIEVAVLQRNNDELLEAIEVRDAGTSKSRTASLTVNFVAQERYLQWEQTTLRARGCLH